MSTAISKIFDTVLSIPGMNEDIKFNIKLPRKTVFFLSKIIERGLAKSPEKEVPAILDQLPEGVAEEISNVGSELLSKAGLKEMNEKLRYF